jgi:hypothetical protein
VGPARISPTAVDRDAHACRHWLARVAELTATLTPLLQPFPGLAVECVDEGSGDVYFFNQVSGESVWERDEIPGI